MNMIDINDKNDLRQRLTDIFSQSEENEMGGCGCGGGCGCHTEDEAEMEPCDCGEDCNCKN
jgi:hypothetical protein